MQHPVVPHIAWVRWLLFAPGCDADRPQSGLAAEPLPRAAELAAAPDPHPDDLDLPAAPAWDRRPLLRLRHRCEDQRSPRLAGAWALGCDALGQVAVAERLTDGLEVELAQPTTLVGTAPGVVGAAHPGVAWHLPDPTPTPGDRLPLADVVAAPAYDGAHLAITTEDSIALSTAGDPVLRSRAAAPLPWFPPAMSWPTLLWVDSRDQDATGLDLWRWEADAGPPRPWVTRSGDQRHVVAAEGWAAWLDDDGVWLERLSDGRRWLHRAESGFRAPPSLWRGVVCWEERTGGEIDVACSDGLRVDGDGDQGWPSRWGPWLLYREGETAWLATAREVVVTRGDPRAEPLPDASGFRLATTWPAAGWCTEILAEGTWISVGPVPVGDDLSWEVPGEALRLRPAARGSACPGAFTL